ncbi:MAG: phenylalanine--tRNA ligase subunit alpha [Dehalococcoidia bacterium]|nr:phenylalanine--tRNA ligase subunit alpha [Dehalococcoidia bacterium]
MPLVQDQLHRIEEDAARDLAATADEAALEGWRVAYLGRRGRLTQVLRGLSALVEEERRNLGAAANQLKQRLEDAHEAHHSALGDAALRTTMREGRLDVTLPGVRGPIGRLHPITQTLRDILGAFASMGFQVTEGPEIEWDRYNFEMLRIPADHPARDLWDTLWMDYERDGVRPMLLRTHTSPNQIRVMESQEPPVRVVVPGKCYRYEATDATHEWMFHQVEGLAVDENISIGDLKGTLYEFTKRMFGSERRVRFRTDYFPFVEPGVEMAMDCFNCRGGGCRTCGNQGWIEILGAGMVHPEVLTGVGYDAERYTGFAFGMGVERIAMLRYGIEDIRHFFANDLRFLRQF